MVLGEFTITHDLTEYNEQLIELREAHRSADEAISTLATLQRELRSESALWTLNSA